MEGSKEKKEVRWYSQEAVAVAEHFQTTAERGLDAATVNAHRARYGLNVLQSAAKKTYLGRFIDQLKDAMILILLVAWSAERVEYCAATRSSTNGNIRSEHLALIFATANGFCL